MNHLRYTSLIAAAIASSCTVAGPPAFPETTTAVLAGPRCEQQGHPCRCSYGGESVGEPPAGYRRFEVHLPNTRGTASAVSVEGIGSMVRDEDDPEGSCFYMDLRPGATYSVRYLARAHSRERGISVAFRVRELADDGRWYDVLQQRCGSSDTPCHYESVSDWTRAVEGGHRFHDPCGSSQLEDMRVDGGLYDRRFSDAQFSFSIVLRQEGPLGPPRSNCRVPPVGAIPPETSPETESPVDE